MSLLFSVIKWLFLMQFYLPFHFFQLSFDYPFLPKPTFCKPKVHRGTPKGGKMSVPFFSNRMALFHVFLRALSFFQS